MPEFVVLNSGEKVDISDMCNTDNEDESGNEIERSDDLSDENADGYIVPDGWPQSRATKTDPTADPDGPLPAALPDPYGVTFTPEEIAALSDTNNPAATKLALGLATPEGRSLMRAEPVEGDTTEAD